MDIRVDPLGMVSWPGHRVRCALGKGGLTHSKSEGDGASPIGQWPLRRVFYRPDRIEKPTTGLSVQEITQHHGWCDDPSDSQYNRLIHLPYAARHENLWREDAIYDVIVELGYNDAPATPGLGSAIFLHVARPDYSGTEGCVAINRDDLLSLLKDCNEGDTITISAP